VEVIFTAEEGFKFREPRGDSEHQTESDLADQSRKTEICDIEFIRNLQL
jgi:hypothetical protein